MRQPMLHVLMFCILTVFSLTVHSQQPDGKLSRPKIALVLSGGGAKGFAHIGVLKVLEQEGIPVDLIVGTSMGSLVGGIYAMGYSASELEEMVKSLNWEKTLSDDIPREFLSKNDQLLKQRYIFSLPVNAHMKLTLPQGLIKGQNVMNIFCSLAANLPQDADFLKLPIPFACVATDLENGQEVVLKNGFLPTAMFSSMAIPIIFQSSDHNGHLLADGGLVNNFPTDVAKQMGADLIIGVDIRNDFFDRKSLGSVDNVVGQLVNFFDQSKDSVNNSLCDLLIRPDISGYSLSSFSNAAADSLIGRGEKAAGEFRSQLRELKEKYHLEPIPTDRKLIGPATCPVSKVTFRGNDHLDPDFLLKTMALEIPGNYSAAEIQRAIQRLYGLGGLEKITFNMQDTISGKILNIHLKTRQVFTQNIGFRANTTDAAAILINMTRKNYRHIFGLLSSSAELSVNPGLTLTAETHQTNLPTVGINVKGKYQNFNIYNEGKKSMEANLFYSSASLYFYQPFMRHLELGMGLQEEYFHGDIFRRHVDITNNGKMNQFLTNAYCYLSFDNMDDFYFPAKGTNLYAEFSLLDDFKNAQKIAPVGLVKLKNVVPVSHQMALLFDGYARILLNSTFPGSRATMVGGEPYSRYFNYHLPFVGMPALSITGRYTYIALIGWRMKVSSAQYVSLLVNGLHHGSEWFSLHQNANVLGTGVRYSVKTMLGPLDMTAGYSPSTDKPTFSASFGLWF